MTVNVTAVGGAWTLNSGAGTLGLFAVSSNVAPTFDVLSFDLTVDAVSVDTAQIDIGQTNALSLSSHVVVSTAKVTATNLDGGSFTVSGSVNFTAAGGTVTHYVLLAQGI